MPIPPPSVRLALASMLLLAPAAHAVDGVVEINDARALAGGVTPGDAPGYPVTLAAPGSYVLTGDLTPPDVNTTAIDVTAAGVALDLNGFAIVGTATPGTGDGIGGGADDVTVSGGTIFGVGANGVTLGERGRVENMRIVAPGAACIVAGDNARIHGSTLVDCGDEALRLGLSSGFGGNVIDGAVTPYVRAPAGDVFEIATNVCGSSTTCPIFVGKAVFATAMLHPSSFGGFAAASAICQSAADAVDLPGTYLAWVADSTESPATRFTQATVPYSRVDGVQIATDWTDLTDGFLLAPISLDENGTAATAGKAWTNVTTSGAADTNGTCGNWTGVGGSGGTGRVPSTSSTWTDDGPDGCGPSRHLYCFEQ